MRNSSSGGRRIIASRRRRPGTTSSGTRERAPTPVRRTSSSGGGLGGIPGSIGRTASSLPHGKGCLSGVGGLLLVIIIAAVIIFVICPGGGMDDGLNDIYPSPGSGSSQIADQPAASPFVTSYSAALSSSPQSGAADDRTWLVMLYQDADDNILEEDIYIDLNEAEKAGSTDRVRIVAQIDRYRGSYSGDGNWSSTKRFLISQDDNMEMLSSRKIDDIGEANMSRGQTLVDFAVWAIKNYPADKYALILSDHGMGWPGGWSDPTSSGSSLSGIPLEEQLGDKLYLYELDTALGQILSQTGVDKFDLVGLDACLMGQLEVFTALEPYARYAVASEEVEPSLGWAYTDFLKTLNQEPGMDAARLAHLIVESYIEDDQRLQDQNALRSFLKQGSPFEGLFGLQGSTNPVQMAYHIGRGSTLSAVDLSKVGALNAGLNQLLFKFQLASQKDIASSRAYSQSYTSIFGSQVPPSYIDLGNFLQILKQKESNSEVNQAADAVFGAIKQAVISEKHGTDVPGSTGIALYFPNSQLYQNAFTGAESYTAIANRFATKSLWDDFLAFHYTGEEFYIDSAQAVMPTRSVRSPAAGGISISPVTSSSQTVAPGQTVTLEAEVSGDNIGYIYLLVGYYDRNANSIFIADQDYLESDRTREANGVYYPDWGEGSFTLEFPWEPVVFAIDDGTVQIPALFKPESYGRDYTEAVYSVGGTYTYAASGEQYEAILYFTNGVLRQVFALTGEGDASAPREIIPGTGDTFTVTETWLDLDSNGQITNTVTQQGTSLTFGSRMFTWELLDAAAGEYAVGFVVEDLDGNQQQALTSVVVE